LPHAKVRHGQQRSGSVRAPARVPANFDFFSPAGAAAIAECAAQRCRPRRQAGFQHNQTAPGAL